MGLVETEGLSEFVASKDANVRTNVKNLIAESEYDLVQVASFSGVGYSTLRALLDGYAAPRQDTLIRLAFVLGLESPGDFYLEPDELEARERVARNLVLRRAGGGVAANSTGNASSTSRASNRSTASGQEESSRAPRNRAAGKGNPRADQQRRAAPKRKDFSCFIHSWPDLLNDIGATREAA